MDIVAAFGCSHAGLIATRRDKAPVTQEQRVYAAFRTVAERIASLEPDAMVMIATDHMQVFPLGMVPMFSIGVGPVARGMGDAGLPAHEYPVHQPLAQSMLQVGLREHDLCYLEDARIDHAFIMPLVELMPQRDIPLVPITVNCNVPPRPSYERCYGLGQSLRDGIAGAGEGRVVVVATGGLSHWVGSPERRAFMDRPAGTRLADVDQFGLALGDEGVVNVDFDQALVEALTEGRLMQFMQNWPPQQLEAEAGNGAHELRNWMVMAGIIGDAPGTVLAYEPVAAWHTGTAVMEFAA